MCLLGLSEGILGQNNFIKVVDQETLRPVENVLVFNQDQSISDQTDHLGRSYQIGYNQDDILTFSHPSFEDFIIAWRTLKSADLQVSIREKIIVIDELVISASRWEQDKRETPHKILSLGHRSVEFSNPQTAADMLGQSGQVFVQKSQLGGGSPIIRGFAANAVLIVVDGVRMNNAIFRSGNLQNVISIDPFTIQSAEILYGPGSVMYGSDALGGVMHFRTKSPGFIEEGEQKLNANAVVRYATANREKTGHLDLTFRSHQLSSFTSISFSDFYHLRSGNKRTDKFPDYGKRQQFVTRQNGQDVVVENPDFDRQIFSGYNQFNLLNKLHLRLGPHSDIKYTFNFSTTSDIPRYDRLIEKDDQGNFASAEWFYGPQKWLTNSLQLTHLKSHKWADATRLTLAWQVLEESRSDRGFQDNRIRTRTEEVDVVTLNLDMEKSTSDHLEWFYGMEWFYNQVNSQGIRRDIVTGEVTATTPRYPDGGSDYYGLAGYISAKWLVSDKVNITSGLRYNQIWLDARMEDNGALGFPFERLQINNRAINGNLGLVWTAAPSWQVNLLYSTGFRAPNVDDIGKIFDGSNGIVTVPNPELRSEFSYNGELTLVKTIEDKLKLSGTVYYTLLDKAIVQRDFTFNGLDSIFFDGEKSKVQALVNTSSANIYGGSVGLNYAFHPNFNLNGSFTVSRGEDTQGLPLRHTTPNFGMAALTYRYQKLRCELNFRFQGKRSFNDLSLGEQQKTHLYTADGALSWQTWNFIGSYHFSKNVTFTAGLENILDKHYRPYSSGISAAGRNLMLSLKVGI